MSVSADSSALLRFALLCSALLADWRADWLESTVGAASLLEMACSTFMVIALTRAFRRPRAKECVKKTGLGSISCHYASGWSESC